MPTQPTQETTRASRRSPSGRRLPSPPSLRARPDSETADLWLTVTAHAPLLSPSQEINLARRVEQGDARARETLVNSNVRLVASVARRYLGRGLPLEDMIQEGLIGLMRAIDKYDYLRGYRFSTYATHWIRQAISRAVANQARCIRLPAHVVDTLGRVARVREELRQRMGRMPTRRELAAATDLTELRISQLVDWSVVPLSLEAPVGDDGDAHLGDFLPCPEEASPADRAFRAVVREELVRALHSLTEREASVIRLRFGLHDDRPRTLEETGRHLGITRERARQIEGQALEKLRLSRAAVRARDALV